jgi:hypothetical protein
MKEHPIIKQNWSNPRKIVARENTIISQYKQRYNLKSIPIKEQYWTMCGKLTDESGNKNLNSEVCQITDSKLIKPKQFYGVEIQENIYKINKLTYPDLNIYHGDFFWVMNNAANEGWFNPAIVNADTIFLQKKAAVYIAKIIYLLSELPKKNIMLIANIVLDHPYKGNRKKDINLFLKYLSMEKKWKDCCKLWDYQEDCYVYAGNNSKHRTDMCSYIFFKK